MQCATCGNTEGLTGQQYDPGEPEAYDGISVFWCPCGARTGRWSGKALADGEVEKRKGGS